MIVILLLSNSDLPATSLDLFSSKKLISLNLAEGKIALIILVCMLRLNLEINNCRADAWSRRFFFFDYGSLIWLLERQSPVSQYSFVLFKYYMLSDIYSSSLLSLWPHDIWQVSSRLRRSWFSVIGISDFHLGRHAERFNGLLRPTVPLAKFNGKKTRVELENEWNLLLVPLFRDECDRRRRRRRRWWWLSRSWLTHPPIVSVGVYIRLFVCLFFVVDIKSKFVDFFVTYKWTYLTASE